MSHSFNSQVGVIDFVYQIKNSEGWESNKNKNNGGENSSDNFNFLGVKDKFVCEFSSYYGYNNVKY